MVFLGVLEGNRYFCVMCCVPISGYLFAGAEDRSTWLRVFNRFCKLFSAILCHARGWLVDGWPWTSEAKGKSNCVLPTSYSHFSWRRPRGMVFGGRQVQLQTMLMVQPACLYLVWMWRKSVVKVHPLWPDASLKWLMVGEIFENAPFSTGNRWCRSVMFYCRCNDTLRSAFLQKR